MLTNPAHKTISFANNGSLSVIGTCHGSIEVWQLQNPLDNDASSIHSNNAVKSLVYSPCGHYIFSASEEPPIINVWQTEELIQPQTSLDYNNCRPVVIRALFDSIHLLVGYEEGAILLWNAATQSIEREFQGHKAEVTSIDVTVAQDLVLSGDKDGSVFVWNFIQGKRLRRFKEHSSSIVNVLFYQQKYMTSANEDGCIIVKDFRTANILFNKTPHRGCLSTLAMCRVRYFDAVTGGYENGIIKVWKLPSMDELCCLRGHTGAISGVHYIPSDSLDVMGCISTSRDKSIRIWNVKESQCLSVLYTDYPVISSAISPSKQLTTLTYGSSYNGYIGMVWYDFTATQDESKGNPVLELLAGQKNDSHTIIEQ